MSSSSSSSSSSAAAATVTVTARDIEFSNYNSSTGKWDNAVFTMMIEDTDTADNINMEVYNEKVYAVFRNHDDPTDLIQTSAEVDGMDFRVTISTPMVASAKYELYKVYGETSHSEYATTSQFYIQVPGKAWDFANDTVDHDIELVSDWWNYGCFTDMNDVVHGFVASTEAQLSLGSNNSYPFVVDGVTYNRNTDIKKLKISSHVQGDMRKIGNSGLSGGGLDKMEDFDIVSSGITYLPINFMKSYNSLFDKKFALPSTLEETPYAGWAGLSRFNRPFWLPDNITMISSEFFRMSGRFNGKLHWPENNSGITIGNEVIAAPSMSYNQPIVWPSKVKSIGTYFLYYSTYNKDFAWPLTTDTTVIPDHTCYQWLAGYNTDNITITIPSGITSIGRECFCGINLVKKIIIPNTVTTIGDGSFSSINGNSQFQVQSLEISFPSSITSTGNNFLKNIRGQNITLGLPSNVITIGSSFLSNFGAQNLNITNWGWDSTNKSLTIPSTVTTIGSGFMQSFVTESRIKKVVVPESVMSIGTGFCSEMANGDQGTGTWYTLEVDLSNVGPSIFADNDTSTFKMHHANGSSQWYAYKIKATIAAGSEEEWKVKLPNIQDPNTGYYLRYIEWVEQPVQYGRVFYRTYNGLDSSFGEEKYVDLQSASEINNLCFTNSIQSTSPIGEEQVTLWNGGNISGRNYITGFICGDDITTIPDNFLKFCSWLDREVKFGKNVVTIGNNCLQAAFDDISGKMQNYIPSGHSQSVKFLGTSLTTIGQNFLHTARYFNADLTLPDGLTSIGYQFMLQTEHFNSNLTFPDSVTSFDARWFMCVPDKMTGTIDFGDMTTSEITSPMDALSTRDSTADCYTVGITIKGTNSTAIINKINNATSLGYRNLIDGGV